jgi:hypothetical protein
MHLHRPMRKGSVVNLDNRRERVIAASPERVADLLPELRHTVSGEAIGDHAAVGGEPHLADATIARLDPSRARRGRSWPTPPGRAA